MSFDDIKGYALIVAVIALGVFIGMVAAEVAEDIIDEIRYGDCEAATVGPYTKASSCVLVPVSREVYWEIGQHLSIYPHKFHKDEYGEFIDLTGIAIQMKIAPKIIEEQL